MKQKRQSGILLHPTSLPGPFGAGDIGESAYHFVDWLVVGKQCLWQVLPLGGVGPGNSPYMSPSAFAGNELLIDLVQLKDAGWLSNEELIPPPGVSDVRDNRVDYGLQRNFRLPRLRRAAERFFADPRKEHLKAFDAFCASARDWLEDYALFMALDREYGQAGVLWQDWPKALARREAQALLDAQRDFATETAFWKFCQWRFFSQWSSLKHYANSRGVEIIGDVPIFVSPHSADVWAHQQLFDLKPDGHPRVIAGVPPDYFSETGQRWGNPLYRWKEHEKQNYRWWVDRMRAMGALYDIVRIDHFRGFSAYWEIPAECETAVGGTWKDGPGIALFDALREQLSSRRKADGSLRIIAEDLGMIDKKVTDLRDAIGLPGMRILQFAFDGKADNWYLPHNYETNTVAYTGTHDNDTTRGWWNALGTQQQDYVRRYLGVNGESIHWDMIRAASASIARIAVFPMQDVLGLDTSHRMNQPGCADGSWEWRFSWNQVAPWHAERLAETSRLFGREPVPAKARHEK